MKSCAYQGNPHRFVETEYILESSGDTAIFEKVKWCQDCGYLLIVEEIYSEGEKVSYKEVVNLAPNISQEEV